MGNMHRAAASPPDLQGLLDGLQQFGALVAHVGHVKAAVFRYDLAKFTEFIRI